MNAIQSLGKLYDARDQLQRLHGEKWPAISRRYGEIVGAVARGKKLSNLSAGIEVARTAVEETYDGMLELHILAATLDLIEADSKAAAAKLNRTSNAK